MGRFIDGQYYRNDEIEPDGQGGWRLKGAGHPAVVTVDDGDRHEGGDAGDEAPVVVVIEPPEAGNAAADGAATAPNPADRETKVIAAKPKGKPSPASTYDTKD